MTLPLTDYSRFGVWCAQFTNDAGEDIRYLPRDQADAAGLPKHDYWLFDSTTLMRMTFDDNDAFLEQRADRRYRQGCAAQLLAGCRVASRHTDGTTLPSQQHLGRD